MPSTPSLLVRLSLDFPSIRFVPSDSYRWHAPDATIFYVADSGDDCALLHEVAHAALHHRSYDRDVQLIEMEQNAWEYARASLTKRYGVMIDDDTIQDSLDTYREWLHTRSLCPGCQATGIQTRKDHYQCLACRTQWRVNEARLCSLRRYTLPPHTKTPS